MVSACFSNGFQSGLSPRKVVFCSLHVALLKPHQTALHPQSALECEVSGCWVPDNRQGLFNRLGQSHVPQPAATNEAKNSLLTRREVDRHGVQEFRSVHEKRRLSEGQPRRPVQFLFPSGEHFAGDRTLGAPSRNKHPRAHGCFDGGHRPSSLRAVRATASMKAVAAATG